MPSTTAKLEDFLNATIMNNFLSVLTEIKSFNHTPIWLGETSSSFGGGAVNLSDTYAAGFLWLDKLGIAALHGLDVVIREDLFQGNFALLNHTMSPLPVKKFCVGIKIVFIGLLVVFIT
jgi:heparanase